MVQLGFARRGGIAEVKIKGTVKFAERGGRVSSEEPTGYHRELTAPEVKKLTGIADPAQLSTLKARMGPSAYPAPDQYVYDIAVELTDGRTYAATIPEQEPESLDKLIPGLGDLFAWVAAECQKIQNSNLR